MTLATETASINVIADGVTFQYDFDFIIPFKDNGRDPAISVVITLASGAQTTLAPVDFSVVGVNNPAGGSITYPLSGPALVNGSVVTILRALEGTQPSEVANSAFLPNMVEKIADRELMFVQQLIASLARTIKSSPADPGFDLPAKVLRKNTALGFDANGDFSLLTTNATIISTSGFVPVETFAVGTPSDWYAAITLGLATTKGIAFASGKNYPVSKQVAMNANNQIFGYGATISALAGFTDNFILSPASGAMILGLGLDGTNLPVPVAAWLGVGTPTGSLMCPTNVNDAQFIDMVFQNCPSGPVFARTCTRLTFSRCRQLSIQGYLANITNGGFEFFGGSLNRVLDCFIFGYNWKGYNLGNESYSIVSTSHAAGGAQNVGHASHYMDGCSDCSYVHCVHTGVGFGFKAHSSIRPRLIDFMTTGFGGAYFQGCSDFTCDTIVVSQTTDDAQAIIIEGINPGGPADTGTVKNFSLIRVAGIAALGINNIGVKMIGQGAGFECKHQLLRDGYISGQFYDIWTANGAGAIYDDLEIDNVITVNSLNGWLLYPKSIKVHNCRPGLPTGLACPILCFSATGVVSTIWEFTDNVFTDLGHATANEAIQIGYDPSNNFQTQVHTVRIIRNYTEGGGSPIHVDITNTAGGAGTNFINNLVVEDNTCFDVGSATGMTLTFNSTTFGLLHLNRNKVLANTTGGKRNIVITNPGQVLGGTADTNYCFSIVGRPENLYPYLGSAVPTTGTWNAGDVVHQSTPVAGQPIGWQCSIAGTPGTWLAMPNF